MNELNFRNHDPTEIIRLFRDLPEKLPNVEVIGFDNSTISNFEDLTADMPKLERITFSDCYINSFIRFPFKTNLIFHNCIIYSFEGLELPVISQNNFYFDEDGEFSINTNQIFLRNCTIRSLSGISRSTIQVILIAVLSMDFPEEKYNDNIEFEKPEFHKQRLHQIELDLPSTALNLLRESINHETESRYSPKLNRNWPLRYTNEFANLPEDHPDRYIQYTIPNFYVDE